MVSAIKTANTFTISDIKKSLISEYSEKSLSFRELEPSARACLAVFFPFYHPGIPGKVTVAPETGIITLIDLAKSSG
jgi:hypothetical protein